MLSFIPNIPPSTPAIAQIADSRISLTSESLPEVSKIVDVYPRDWSFQALKSLIKRYGIKNVYLTNKPLKRDEFAQVLTASINALHTAKIAPQDLSVLQRLSTDFLTEASYLDNRLNAVSRRLVNLENHQFSPTATLSGEVIVGISDDFGQQTNDNLTLQQRIKLDFETSFFGEDELKISLVQGNVKRFSYVGRVTYEGRLSFDTKTNWEINTLSYRFPLSENASVFLASKGDGLNPINSLFDSRAKGSISRFGRKNPIYHLADSGGINLNIDFSDSVSFLVGYYAGELDNSESSNGLFSGDYSFVGRLKFEPNDDISFGFLYIHSYNDSNLRTGTGSKRSQLDLDRPVVGNSYGFEASFQLTPNFVLGGWVGLTEATVINLGDAQIWNYALTFGVPDLGQKGNLLGFVIGMEPKLTTSGFIIDDQKSDGDTSLHLEVFYRYKFTDNISITPGFIWLTSPDHNPKNSDIVVFTTRISLKF